MDVEYLKMSCFSTLSTSGTMIATLALLIVISMEGNGGNQVLDCFSTRSPEVVSAY